MELKKGVIVISKAGHDKGDFQVVVDFDENYLLKSDKTSLSNYLKTLTSAGIISINEARNMLGYDDIEGGDRHIIPFTDINQNTIDKDNEDVNYTDNNENNKEE